MIRRHPVHVLRRGRDAAEEIAASHYQADLHTGLGNFGNFFLEVDGVANDDHATICALAAKYGVEILE